VTVLDANFIPTKVSGDYDCDGDVDGDDVLAWQRGDVIRLCSAIDNELLYTGRRRDPETGLQLNRNRFYHSQLGRWVNRDPIGYDAGDMNLYEYVGSRPTFFQDPEGLAYGKKPKGKATPIKSCPPKNPGNEMGDGWCSEGANSFHPGAKECFREPRGPGPGNQCCYDDGGNLITDGPGAGTPDRASPAGGEDDCGDCTWDYGITPGFHFILDVLPHLIGFD